MQPFELPDFYVPWPARLNPNLDAARIHSKAWAQKMGILDGMGETGSPRIWEEQVFDRHDYALLCAYIHPETPIPELNLMTDWNVWAFYVDDYFLHLYKGSKDRATAKAYLDRIILFMPVDLGPLPAPTNPTERALADLWQRTAPSKSKGWRMRIAEDTRSLLDAFLWELDNKNQGRLANPIEYIEMRRQVGAALWSADLVEHAMFVEIPERVVAARPMQVLKNTFADAVHLRNDIFSYQREVVKQGELTNAVLVIEHFLGAETLCAVNLVNDLLTSRLQQFEHTALTELAPLFVENQLDPKEQADVLTYIRGLQDWQSGAHEWHIQTSRYLNPANEQTTSTGIFSIPKLKGLGSAAVRITPGTIGLNRLKNYQYIPYQKVGPTHLPEFYMPFKTSMNPHLETTRRHSKTWARQMGMLDGLPGQPNVFIWDEHSFMAADAAFFCALFHPNATIDQLDLDTCWMAWGTYTDDYFLKLYEHTHDIAGAKIFLARLSEFMPLDSLSPTIVPLIPVERALADLWSRTIPTLSVDERRLFRKLVENLIGGFIWELSNQIQNRIPDPIDYLEMRHKTCGSEIIMVLPRLVVYGKNVPPEVYHSHIMQELSNAAMDYTGLANDIFSYQKEIEFEGCIHNGVLVIQNFLGCDRMKAVEIVRNLMTARMQQFEHIVATKLQILFENFNLNAEAREQVLGYVKEFQAFMGATLQWHIQVSRYKEFELYRTAQPFIGGPMGLGTAAAKILTVIATDVSVATDLPLRAEDTSKIAKPFAVSHLAPPWMKKEDDASTD